MSEPVEYYALEIIAPRLARSPRQPLQPDAHLREEHGAVAPGGGLRLRGRLGGRGLDRRGDRSGT